MWFRFSAGVAADQACRARGLPEFFHQGHGVAVRLVGDDAPGHVALIEFGDQGGDAGKDFAAVAQVRLVVLQESVAQAVVVGCTGFDVESEFEQSARAVRGLRADDFRRQGSKVAQCAHMVQRLAHIGCGVGKRAVEIEENGINHVDRQVDS